MASKSAKSVTFHSGGHAFELPHPKTGEAVPLKVTNLVQAGKNLGLNANYRLGKNTEIVVVPSDYLRQGGQAIRKELSERAPNLTMVTDLPGFLKELDTHMPQQRVGGTGRARGQVLSAGGRFAIEMTGQDFETLANRIAAKEERQAAFQRSDALSRAGGYDDQDDYDDYDQDYDLTDEKDRFGGAASDAEDGFEEYSPAPRRSGGRFARSDALSRAAPRYEDEFDVKSAPRRQGGARPQVDRDYDNYDNYDDYDYDDERTGGGAGPYGSDSEYDDVEYVDNGTDSEVDDDRSGGYDDEEQEPVASRLGGGHGYGQKHSKGHVQGHGHGKAKGHSKAGAKKRVKKVEEDE